MMMTYFKRWFKMAKNNPKVSAGIVIAIIVLYTLIF
jgi:hypothetical protein